MLLNFKGCAGGTRKGRIKPFNRKERKGRKEKKGRKKEKKEKEEKRAGLAATTQNDAERLESRFTNFDSRIKKEIKTNKKNRG